MLKKALFLFIVLSSICLMNVSTVFSAEANLESSKTVIKDVYIDFLNEVLLLKSMSAQYLPHLYPAILYIGPSYTRYNHHNNVNHTTKDAEMFLIDLKWQLNEKWFWGIYSKIDREDEYLEDNDYQQIENPIDTEIGIVFIHKF